MNKKTLEEYQEYHDRLQVVAEQAIAFDLDDGVIVNYAKFGGVLQKIKQEQKTSFDNERTSKV